MAQKPKYKVVAKSKSTGKAAKIAALWVNEKGWVSGKLEDEVHSIKLATGQVVTNDNCYINMYINDDDENQGGGSPSDNQNQGQPQYDEDDVPF